MRGIKRDREGEGVDRAMVGRNTAWARLGFGPAHPLRSHLHTHDSNSNALRPRVQLTLNKATPLK